MDVTLITATHSRPEAFALCERWMGRALKRFRGRHQWIVVDDGPVAAKCTLGQMYLRREPPASPPAFSTLCDNLIVGLDVAEGEVVMFIDDDDWYREDYVEMMYERVVSGQDNMVGLDFTPLYNVRLRRWSPAQRTDHGSSCRTAFRRELIPFVRRCCEITQETRVTGVDLLMWGTRTAPGLDRSDVRGRLLTTVESSGAARALGVKGLPAPVTTGRLHTPEPSWSSDPNLGALRSMIGPDADAYAPFFDAQATKPRTVDDERRKEASTAVAAATKLARLEWSSFVGRWPRTEWVVVGLGPSAVEAAAALPQYRTIGVNDCERALGFTPELLVALNDQAQLGAKWDAVRNNHSSATFSHLPLVLATSPLVQLRLGTMGAFDFSDPAVVHYSRDSTFVAAVVAFHLGARRIGVIGADFVGKHELVRHAKQINDHWAWFRTFCATRDVEVVNLSRRSRLTHLAPADLESFGKADEVVRERERLERALDSALDRALDSAKA